jgi:uncharacterized membrane protein
MEATAAITVRCTRDEAYRSWRDLERLPLFMSHLQSVEITGPERSHWVARAPAGTVEWDAEIVEDMPGQAIMWHSVGNAVVENSGSVRFNDAPGDRGTEIRVQLRYELPAGKLGSLVATLLGEEPAQQVRDDLRRFKQVIETGAVVRSEGSPGGTRTSRMVKQRPAQPLPDAKS